MGGFSGPVIPDTPERSHGACDGFVVVASDTVDLPGGYSRGLWIGTGGDLNVIMVNGSTVLFKNVPGGCMLPICVTRVKATGTTALNILNLR